MTCPIVVRAPSGGNVGGGLYHSQNPEAWFIHRPGLKVVAPSNAWDAKGLLKAAIRDDNPVVYMEHKYLYRRAKGPVPEGDEIVPIGVAAVRRPGSDATLVTYGAMVTPSLEAADRLAKEGVEVEVIDLRSLMPYDKAAIFASVEKTSRLLIVHEDVKTLGLGAEISAVVVEERFDALDAPVMRVTYPDTHCPFSQVLESYNLPNADKISDALASARCLLRSTEQRARVFCPSPLLSAAALVQRQFRSLNPAGIATSAAVTLLVIFSTSLFRVMKVAREGSALGFAAASFSCCC